VAEAPEARWRSQVPYRFERSDSVESVCRAWGHLVAGEEGRRELSIAGRVMRWRPQGRLAFGELRDWTGSIQLFCSPAWTERFSEVSADLRLGDWVGAVGRPVRTRRGELSLRAERVVFLAGARQGFGDKWHGVRDPDLRFRHREVDLWANPRSSEVLLLRSRIVALLRAVLAERGFVEVETPMLHPIPGGALARPFVTHHRALDQDMYLRIAPELYLKRLVVGGFERVFELGRVFRNEGLSPRHNPEFTMLEAYFAYGDYVDAMALTEEVVSEVARRALGTTTVEVEGRPLELAPPWRRASLEELVAETAGVEVDPTMERDELARIAEGVGVSPEPSWGPGKLVLEIYEKTTEGTLFDPVFVCDYPREVSPLARAHRRLPERVERFEAIVAGRELANAFSELNDPDDQRERFVAQSADRAAGDEEAMAYDTDYLDALEHGLPPTAGLGIGVDRLVMLLAGVSAIREVIAFPTLRRIEPPSA
jgi:lysyl-tRNA synthetase class 2